MTAASPPQSAATLPKSAPTQICLNFFASALAGMSASGVFHPLDCLRIRWQLVSSVPAAPAPAGSLAQFTAHLARKEGVWRGICAPALGTQVVLGFFTMGAKWGAYAPVRDAIAALRGDDEKSATTMAAAGFLSGSVAYCATSPFYQTKNRLIADAGKLGADGVLQTGLRAGQPRLYRGAVDVLRQIVAKEGAAQLWRGAIPLTLRGSVLNAGHATGYDGTKTICKKRGLVEDGLVLHVFASVNAAALMCTLANPFDVVSNRYQAAPTLGVLYASPIECALSIARKEGGAAFFRGWLPFFGRHAPLLSVLMPLYEQFRVLLGIGFLD